MQKRTILSGNKKSVNLTSITKNTKAPKLIEHTQKIELRLAKLKQQVEQKRRQTFTKQKPIIQVKNKVDKQLFDFLANIGMLQYEKLLCENRIDTFQIIQEAKQKDLQQIGIVKGHALKIIVSLRKLLQSRNKKARKQLSSAETAQNTQKIRSKATDINKLIKKQITIEDKQKQAKQVRQIKQTKNPPLQIVIQTEAISCGQEQAPKRRYFCLYCYQVSMAQFCSENCEAYYNKMFQRYQKNLTKVQQLYGQKLQRVNDNQENQQEQQNQFVTDLQFLDAKEQNLQKDQNFNEQQYEEALQFIRNINIQSRDQEMQKLLEQKQQSMNGQ